MDTISILYTASGMMFGAAFFPQIMTLLKDKSGAVSTNLSTWGMFALCSLITLTYAYTHNGDIHFIFCSAIGTAGNLIIFTLGAFRRLQYARIALHAGRVTVR